MFLFLQHLYTKLLDCQERQQKRTNALIAHTVCVCVCVKRDVLSKREGKEMKQINVKNVNKRLNHSLQIIRN